MNYPFSLPALPYAYDALEPYIDAQTMMIHHTKHHQAYIDNLNKAIESYPHLHTVIIQELLTGLDDLPPDIITAVRNHGGGHWNHSFFWKIMKPGGSEPHGKILESIVKTFGSFAEFQEQFNAAAKKVFGSGWAWLSVDMSGNLVITSSVNQDSPISSHLWPVMGIDVWEHAYYLKYQNRRPDYIGAWWHVLDWEQIERNYIQAAK